MDSRLLENPETIFECFFEVAAPEDDKSAPKIISQFPKDFKDDVVNKELPKFCFPCDLSVIEPSPPINKRYNPAGQLFTFVLTNIDNMQRFGFCRHPPGARSCLCFFSYLPWFEIFYKILNTIAELKHSDQDETALKIIKQLYNSAIPEPKKLLTVSVADNGRSTEMHFSTPDPKSLPRIPESRNFMEFFSAVNPSNMMILFVSLLYERRVLITSEKLSRLTACVHGAASLLYPLFWQHIYTPVLPAHLIDYCCAPMPFLVGVHSSFMKKVRSMPLDEVIILNVDTNAIEAPFDDFEELPTEAIRELKKNLKNSSACVGDGVARSFLKTLVYLFGSYKEGMTVTKMDKGENQIEFDRERFVQSRSPHLQPFLERSLTLQHFERFIDARLDTISNGKGYPSDVFEQQLEIERQEGGSLSNKNRLQKQIAGQFADSKDRVIKARKIVAAKAKQGMIHAQGSIRANPDAIKARLKQAQDQVSTFSHHVSQQVKTDDMKATFQKGFNKTKDIGRVGIGGVKTAAKHVKTRVKGSKDDIDAQTRMTVYGTHDIDSPFGTLSTGYRSGSVPASPAESPVAVRHIRGLASTDGVRPVTELFPPGIKHYNTIELSSPQEEGSESTDDSGMDLMNDPDLKQVIAQLSPDKPSRPPPPVRQNSSGPPPIPPPRRVRAKKVNSSPVGGQGKAPALPPPAPSTRSGRRTSQEGQLINIDDDSPTKPSRNSDNTDSPLINVIESPEGLPKSPSAGQLFEFGGSDTSSEDGHLDVMKSLKGSNSTPNLITYEEPPQSTSQSETLVDPFSSMNVGKTVTPQSSGNSSPHMFSDSFNPVVSSTTQALQSSQVPAFSSSSSSSSSPSQANRRSVPLNPFSDSFVPMTMSSTVSTITATVPSTTTTASQPQGRVTSLPNALSTPVPLGSATLPAHPAFMSQVPLQPTNIQKRSKSETEAPKAVKDPFAELVSFQLQGSSPNKKSSPTTWNK
ncbi:DENN domain-containing protein 1A-like isoform X2 [Amphiura filiformis]|uniref:DENN domain-containing protein 1A-like isoform X2 n=1 Tax=Amphiura filiformis TaxID=82378 RepID=UPI003B22338F